MAFDEEVHYGLIQLYSEQLSPYGIEPTSDMAYLGLGPAEVSYVFHWFMSFPYRLLIDAGLGDEAIIVILRMINVAMVAGAILVYRKALLVARVPRGITHGSLAAFTLIPILPIMAGQLNYDNLLLLLVAYAFYMTFSITESVYTNKKLPVMNVLLLAAIMLISIPVKYAYLPIGLGMGLWLVWLVYVSSKKSPKKFISDISKQFLSSHILRVVGITALLIAGTFFGYRYVDNVVQYGSAIPSCDQVFERMDCFSYGPWARTQNYLAAVDPDFQPFPFPLYLAAYWVPDMIQRLTFAVAGPTNTYETKLPLPLLRTIGVVFVVAGVVAFVMRAKQLLRRWPYMTVTLLVSLIYMGVLAVKLYSGYSNTSIPAAINGRYLMPLLPLLFALLAQSIMYVAKEFKVQRQVILGLAILFAIAFTQGGGVFTYIVSAETYWFWEGWGAVSHSVLKAIVSPITWQL